MSTRARNKYADRLQRVRDFLDNLTNADDELKTELETVAINAARIAEGETLYDNADKAIRYQDRMHASLVGLRRDARAKRLQRSAIYRKQWERAAEDITNSFVRTMLKLDKKPATRINELHLEMRHFYNSALEHPELHATLATTGLTVEAMNEGIAALSEIERYNSQISMARLASLDATKAQKTALDAVEGWYSARMIEATYATREKPHLMKALGRKRVRGAE